MFTIDVQPFASDALEDAMRLAQTKALNSFTFSDCLNYLNYAWSDLYSQLALVDEGYYSRTIQLTKKLTKLPAIVKNTVKVYRAQSPIGYNRQVYRESGQNDLNASGTYHISGTDLWCPDAEKAVIWLNYVPQPPMLFFTHHNRDPKLVEDIARKVDVNFSLYRLRGFDVNGDEVDLTDGPQYDITGAEIHKPASINVVRWVIEHKITQEQTELSINNEEDPNWQVYYICCDFPYIFVSYRHAITEEHLSGFFTKDMEFVEYNPFAFTGRNSNVEYVSVKWNDKTGLGVTIKDWNEMKEVKYIDPVDDIEKSKFEPQLKELGWTPDTRLIYPAPEMYRYLVARLADKFSALNESNILGVQKELTEARWAFQAFIEKDKSAWKRIDNVNGPTIADWL